MKFKEGVSPLGLHLSMRPVLIIASEIWAKHGQELVITETIGANHSPGSAHYYGYAVDLRTNYFDDRTKMMVFQELANSLSIRYRRISYLVLLEETHIHVQNQSSMEAYDV